jgi:hypothetical protein
MTIKLGVAALAGLLKLQYTVMAYFEATPDLMSTIAREKQIKGHRRKKKTASTHAMNPGRKDWCSDLTV